MSQRTVINTQTFTRDGGTLQAQLPLVGLTRLLDMLVDSAGVLSFRLDGKIGANQQPQLLLQIDGTLSVRCQRCLGGIETPLKINRLFEFMELEEELTLEEVEDESKDFLLVQSELDVAALVEDEILLDLSSVPRHENCALPHTEPETEKLSPFSVLKGFKGKA